MVRRTETVAAVPARRDEGEVVLGRGRAGVVYRRAGAHGPVAVKVFVGEPLSDLVNTVLTGAPNPYSWSRSAVRCAYYRRRIVAALVRFWFGERLSVANALATKWNAEASAWELHAELVDGYAPALRQPFSTSRDPEARDLAVAILPRLQAHLGAAGMDGLLWQAGRGNPVALSNFLVVDRRRSQSATDPPEPVSWAWIDLESGVPALFPADPRALLRDYVPASIRHGRPLFDDVDTARLRRYIESRGSAIDAQLGDGTAAGLRRDAIALARHQRAWKDASRVERGVRCALARGQISTDEADRYRTRPWRWIGRTVREAGRATASRLAASIAGGIGALALIRPGQLVGRAARFLIDPGTRERVGRRYVLRRIRHWTRRGQLGRREAGWLRRATHRHDQATYLSDFAVHLALKPFYKVFAWLAVPAAVQVGLLPLWVAPAAMLAAGAMVRTAYTLSRMAQAAVRGRPRPWVALAVGMLPVVGSTAYPLQLLAASRGNDGKLAGFLVYDALGSIGRNLPIWGGADTGAEHATNRLGDWAVRDRGPLLAIVEPR